MTDKLIVSLRNIFFTIYNAIFPWPIITALALGVIAFFAVIIYKKAKFKEFKFNSSTVKSALLFFANSFFTCLYFLILVQITLTNRLFIDYTIDPLSSLWGGWYVYSYGYSYDYTPLGNFMLFTPIAFLLDGFFKKIYRSRKTGVLLTVAVGFSISLCIELSQLMFALGTFQFSDLFYNTLGSLAGALLFSAVKKASRKR